MQVLTDRELQFLLQERGYHVPLMVIATWARGGSQKRFSREAIERWICHGKRGRPAQFPQCLIAFDVVILRKMRAMDEIARHTPRLSRGAA